jgi:hypothetical protein
VRIPLKLMLLFVLPAITSLMSGQTSQAVPEPFFSITIKAPETVKTGSTVELEVVLTNTSNQTIRSGEQLGGAQLNYDIDVRDGEGHAPPETSYGRKLHGKDRALAGGEASPRV